MNMLRSLILCTCLLVGVTAFGGKDVVESAYPIVEKEHIYYDGDLELYGYMMYQDIPGSPVRPGLLIFPYFMGTPALYTREVALKYAKKGMAVFIADYYGKQLDEDSQDDIGTAFSIYQPFLADWETAQRIALLGLTQLTDMPIVDADKTGVIGFCMGGSMTGKLARAGGKSLVSIALHGQILPSEGEPSGDYNVGYYASFYGRDDPMIPPSVIEEDTQWLQDSVTGETQNYETVIYGKTVHSFTYPPTDALDVFIKAAGYSGAVAYDADRDAASFSRIDEIFQMYGLIAGNDMKMEL